MDSFGTKRRSRTFGAEPLHPILPDEEARHRQKHGRGLSFIEAARRCGLQENEDRDGVATKS